MAHLFPRTGNTTAGKNSNFNGSVPNHATAQFNAPPKIQDNVPGRTDPKPSLTATRAVVLSDRSPGDNTLSCRLVDGSYATVYLQPTTTDRDDVADWSSDFEADFPDSSDVNFSGTSPAYLRGDIIMVYYDESVGRWWLSP